MITTVENIGSWNECWAANQWRLSSYGLSVQTGETENSAEHVLETQQLSEPEEKPLSHTQIYTIS